MCLHFDKHTGRSFWQRLDHRSETKIMVASVIVGQIDLPDSGKKKNVTIEITSRPQSSDGETTIRTKFGTRVRRKYRRK